MSLFRWTEDYSVGVQDMDKHHKKLFDILNLLHASLKEGKAADMIDKIIHELLEYTKYHFGEEEKLMQRIGYSDLPQQQKAHQKFISEIEGYEEKAKIKTGSAGYLSPRISILLTDWLKNHIGGMDKKYKNAMNNKGIR